jgi:hypothetical protein
MRECGKATGGGFEIKGATFQKENYPCPMRSGGARRFCSDGFCSNGFGFNGVWFQWLMF